MTLEEKYRRTVLVLQAIAQREIKNGYRDEAFYSCREAARKCLDIIGELTKIPRESSKKKCSKCYHFCGDETYNASWCIVQKEIVEANGHCEFYKEEIK